MYNNSCIKIRKSGPEGRFEKIIEQAGQRKTEQAGEV